MSSTRPAGPGQLSMWQLFWPSGGNIYPSRSLVRSSVVALGIDGGSGAKAFYVRGSGRASERHAKCHSVKYFGAISSPADGKSKERASIRAKHGLGPHAATDLETNSRGERQTVKTTDARAFSPPWVDHGNFRELSVRRPQRIPCSKRMRRTSRITAGLSWHRWPEDTINSDTASSRCALS